MIRIFNCVIDQHSLWLVLVAAVLCVAGSWSVIRLYRRSRSATGAEALGWHFLTATAAGASIWATHFVAMIAYEPGAPVTFDPVLTILSLMVAMVGSFSGFLVAGMLPMRAGPAIGGAMVGLSVAVMHYTGMLAYRAQGVVEWDATYVVVSLLLAAAFTAAALHAASLTGLRHGKALSVSLMTVAIISLHFTGMTAFKLTPIVLYNNFSNPAAMQAMALSVALVSLMIVGAVLASYLIDSKTRSTSLSQLKHMALNDALTGLANRAAYNDHLAARIQLANSGGQKFALAAIDLDRFKEINDIRGHGVGDDALRMLAQRMRDFNDGNNFVARVGGDEFAFIMPADSRSELRKTLMRLRAELLKPITLDGFDVSVGASIGVCIFPDDAEAIDSLVNNTDLALYRAKTEVSDKICFFDNVMDEAVRTRRALATELRQAIENDELEIFYQVQTLVSDETVSGYEALLRWKHPLRGYIPPAEFIPLAEDNGLILQLGEWVLRTVCTQCATLDMGGRIAVNLSPIQFLHPNLPGLVADILHDTGMRADKLELELTESAIIADKERTLVQLQEIRRLGVTIALDDFGTGYSSLDTLRAFPFDKIKLDRTFMDRIETSQQARSIVRAVLALGRSLEIPVLAEGIETSDQLSILREEGCSSAQGYYLGRPAPLTNVLSIRSEKAQAAELRAVLEQLRSGGTPAEVSDPLAGDAPAAARTFQKDTVAIVAR
jgi:diguanylate cyclase (GGDEF)-like protein